MDIVRTFEATKAHVAQLQATGPLQVHSVASKRTSSSHPPCSRCRTSQGSKWEACPAHRQKFHACGRRGHYAQFCRTESSPTSASSRTNAARRPKSYGRKKGTSAERNVSSVDAVAEDFATLTFEVVEISDISTENNITAQVQFNLDDGRVANLRGKVDTGEQGNILPIRLFRQMFPERVDKTGRPRDGMLKLSSVILKAHGGTNIPHLGECVIDCCLKDRWCDARFFITGTTGPALFDLPLIKGLNLLDTQKDIDNVTSTSAKQPLNKAAVLAEFPECFDGIGELKGTYHITLDPEVEPVINSLRRVPIALKDEIKAELASMEHEGVIEKVQEGQPTDWVNSIVYHTKSNGKLRICLDPRDLNTAIKREHHVTPTLEDITPKMSGAKYFSTVDAKCGYQGTCGWMSSQVFLRHSTLHMAATDSSECHSDWRCPRISSKPGSTNSSKASQESLPLPTTLWSSERLKKNTMRTWDDFSRAVASTGWSWIQTRVKSVNPKSSSTASFAAQKAYVRILGKYRRHKPCQHRPAARNLPRFLVWQRIWHRLSQIWAVSQHPCVRWLGKTQSLSGRRQQRSRSTKSGKPWAIRRHSRISMHGSQLSYKSTLPWERLAQRSFKTANPSHLPARHCHRQSRVTPTSNADFSPSCMAVRDSTTTCLADPSPSSRITSRLQVFTWSISTPAQHGYVACLCVFNCMTWKSSTNPEQKCTSPTHCHDCRVRTKTRSLFWTSQSTKSARSSLRHSSKKSAQPPMKTTS